MSACVFHVNVACMTIGYDMKSSHFNVTFMLTVLVYANAKSLLLQSELFSKLRKRKSTMSSDEDDDDYGFRPSTQVTFDDVTGRGRSKV